MLKCYLHNIYKKKKKMTKYNEISSLRKAILFKRNEVRVHLG